MNGTAVDETPASWRVPGADVPVDLVAVREAIVRVGEEAAEILGDVTDFGAPVPRSEWTAGDAAAHLILVLRGFTAAIEGRLDAWGTPEGQEIARVLADVGHPLEAGRLAGHLRDAVPAFVHAAAGKSPDHRFSTPWYEVDKTNLVGPMTCLVLGEVVLHGCDVAMAIGRPWPIDPEDSRRIISGVFPVKAPALVNPDTAGGVRASFELHVDGGPEMVVRFCDGDVTVEPGASGPVDCHLGGDPEAVLLLGYGRADVEELFAQGRVRAWGDDPSLGPRFKSFLKNP